MKLLLNMNIPRSFTGLLEESGHTARHAGNIGLAKALDAEILKEARNNNEIIITHDLDYGQLLYFEGAKDPSVIIFRVRNTFPDRLFSLLKIILPKIEHFLIQGAVIIIEEDIIRIRSLPILKGKSI